MALRFEDLRVWKVARVLARQTYSLTRQPGFASDRGLANQLRRAAVSVMANIAEGYERRGSAAEFAHFLAMAKGSCGELRCHLYVASDQRYIGDDSLRRLGEQAADLSRMLNLLIRAVRRSHRDPRT